MQSFKTKVKLGFKRLRTFIADVEISPLLVHLCACLLVRSLCCSWTTYRYDKRNYKSTKNGI